MKGPRIIPEAVLRLQITASDPAVSAWVAANAGSGKTHVLAQRVIRLLLDGVEPTSAPFYQDDKELWDVLMLCYRSLNDVGQEVVAHGRLLDLIRRLRQDPAPQTAEA